MDLENVTLTDLEDAMAEADRLCRQKLLLEGRLNRRRLVAEAVGATPQAVAAMTLDDWPEYLDVDEVEAKRLAAVVRVEVLAHLLMR